MENQQLPEGTFTGFQAIDPVLTDWVAGAETGISAPQNPKEDWRPYLPNPKCQLILVNGVSYGDTESCTNFSATNNVATYLNFLNAEGLIPVEALAFLKDNGYFDATGKISLSPRYSAITSGTTGANGDNLPAVWQAIRTQGVVPAALCDFPIAEWAAKIATGSYTVEDLWDIWFNPAAVTPEAAALGKQFLTFFTPQYQWVSYPGAEGNPTTLAAALATAPFQIATSVCLGWNTADPIQGCGAGAQHATEMTAVESAAYDIFDHYTPYQKQMALDYVITYAMQGVLVPNATVDTDYPAPEGFKYDFTAQLDLGASGVEVVALQNALKVDGEFPLTVQSTGLFGGITQVALEKFQAKYGIATEGTPATTGYGRVGPKTLVELNKLFNTGVQ